MTNRKAGELMARTLWKTLGMRRAIRLASHLQDAALEQGDKESRKVCRALGIEVAKLFSRVQVCQAHRSKECCLSDRDEWGRFKSPH